MYPVYAVSYSIQLGWISRILCIVLPGLGLGIGIPIFLVRRDERDEERVAEIRELNQATKEATGEYMSEVRVGKVNSTGVPAFVIFML